MGCDVKKHWVGPKNLFVRLDELGPLSISLLFVQKMAADGFFQLSMLFHFSCWVIICSPIGHTMQKASAYWFLRGELTQLVIFGLWNGGGHIGAWHLHQIWRVIAYVMKAENDNCGLWWQRRPKVERKKEVESKTGTLCQRRCHRKNLIFKFKADTMMTIDILKRLSQPLLRESKTTWVELRKVSCCALSTKSWQKHFGHRCPVQLPCHA